MAATLTALALNGTLKPSGIAEGFSTNKMLELLTDALENEGVSSEILRLVDHNTPPGVTFNEGAGDDWPIIRKARQLNQTPYSSVKP